MSWLARSFVNSLRLDDEEIQPGYDFPPSRRPRPMELIHDDYESENEDVEEIGTEDEGHGRGVKEDLTEFKKTLSRQFWGVANFLAPPPSDHGDHSINHDPNQAESPDPASSVAEEEDAISDTPNRPDHDEDFEDEEGVSEDECRPSQSGCVGITDEVLTFAENIAMHPETWLDFPLEEDNFEGGFVILPLSTHLNDLSFFTDFEMSDAQRKHAFTIEHYAPRLAALRIELCPFHMNESYFWTVYFVLLHSRLNKHDVELLYTPQVMEARTKWMDELHKQTKPEDHWDGARHLFRDDHRCSEETEVHCVDKSVINEKLLLKPEARDVPIGSSEDVSIGSSKAIAEVDEDDGWLEEDSDLGSCYKGSFSIGNDDEISFSDLEDDK